MPDIRYPRLIRRLQAALIDAFVFILVFFLFGFLLSRLGLHGGVNAALFAAVVLILEPGLVCKTGGTLGHHALGLKIQDQRSADHLNPLMAFIRFVAKWLIGGLSFIFVLVTKRHQAIHDLLSGSIVVIRNPTDSQGLPERGLDLDAYELPSAIQRVCIIAAYIFATLIVLVTVLFFTLSKDCMDHNRCTATEGLIETAISLVWIGLCVGALYYGWAGRLPGAKRTPRSK